jgi:cytochrome P450/NADPH-cytochrome P450 reductase
MNKWDRLNPGERVDVPADMTRLTLDTIALCGFGIPIQLVLSRHAAPIRAGDDASARRDAGRGSGSLPLQTRLKISAQRQFEEDQAFMASLVDDLIRKRRAMGDAADNTGPARPDAHWSRQTDWIDSS